MAIGIIFILLVALIAFVHYLQGFFSATISAIIAVVSALLAVGWHENVLAMVKPGKFADSATAMVLCALFAVIYVILRVIFDKLIPGNVRVKSTIDKVGGALMGAVAGIFTVGLVAVALQSMPLSPAIGGYSRYFVDGEREVRAPMPEGPAKDRKVYDAMRSARFEPADLTKLILPVDDMLVGLVSSASNGCLSGGTSFSSIHPDWLQELFGQRLGIEIGAKRTANNLGTPPEVSVKKLYFVTGGTDAKDNEVPQIRGEKALENSPPGTAMPAKDSPMVADFKKVLAAKKPVFVVRTQINHNASDSDSLFRVSPGAVRLVVKGADGTAKDYYPIGTVDDLGTFYLNRMDDPILVSSLEEVFVDFAFEINPDELAEPAAGGKAERQVKPGTFLEVKRFGRVDLAETPGVVVTTPFARRGEDDVPKLDPVLRKSLIKKPPAKPEGT